ncbi:MAG: hypothetical protein JO217_06335 [Acidobacteriaceae bacterium]|nr:hypothetical protein [Acidobacteriaceae bacterium]MBV9442294.1 hypothetical protein [Acidobacteriaceae bacterium]
MDNEFASANFFSGSSAYPQDACNLPAEYSLAAADTPLHWTNTISYYLPFGEGKMLLDVKATLAAAPNGVSITFAIRTIQQEQ